MKERYKIFLQNRLSILRHAYLLELIPGKLWPDQNKVLTIIDYFAQSFLYSDLRKHIHAKTIAQRKNKKITYAKKYASF